MLLIIIIIIKYYSKLLKYFFNKIEMDTPTTLGNTINNKPKCNLTITLLVTVLFIVIVIAEYYLNDYMYTVSISFISYLQTKAPYLTIISNVFTYFGTVDSIVFFLLFTFNFGNTYQIFLLFTIFLFGCNLGGILKLIYLAPRPIWTSPYITALSCEGGWGNPSNHGIISVSFYLTLYQIFIEDSIEKISKRSKRIYLSLLLLFIFCVCFSRIFLGVHSISQILFGACIGLYIYFFFFYIMCINSNNWNQLLLVIQNKTGISLVVIALSLLPLIPYSFIQANPQLVNEWNRVINIKCPDYPQGIRFEHDAFLCTWIILIIIPCLFGMSYEYHYIFNSNVSKWSRINFNTQSEEGMRLLSSFSIEKTCWNSTDIMISILRLIAITGICAIIMIPNFVISYDANFFIVICGKFLLPIGLIGFLMFSYFKQVCFKLKLVNDTLFNKTEMNKDEEAALLLHNQIDNDVI